MNILILVITLLFLYYLKYAFLITKGLKRKYLNPNVNTPFVSVVVAARNEQENISNLLTCLVNQDYPQDKYEIVVSDDQSIDRTGEIIKRFSGKFDNIKLVSVQVSGNVASRKKNALSAGLAEAKGEIILTTDADCVVKSTWISGMIRYFVRGVGMVSGLSLPQINFAHSNIVEKYEYFDMTALFSAAAGVIGIDKAFSCSGQNLAYTKEAYNKIGGYGSIMEYESGDDILLMQLIRKAGYKINFAFGKTSYNGTKSEKNLFKFLNQRIRWASNENPQSFLNREFLLYLIDVFLLNILIIAAIFINPLIFFSSFILKSIADFWVIKAGFKRFDLSKKHLWFFPVWAILQPIYIFITGLGGKLKIYQWKK
ncbi:MAG: glycosyltransferase [Candidatus Cloacimonadota bacterium]|nr:glycosyltransferase [Candidatus Cloacimonadota bacterium]